MYKKIIFYFLSIFVIANAVFALGIYSSDKYAWGDETGWVNFKADDGNVDILDSELNGYLWSDNYGWINLNPTNGGVVNNGSGILSGNAWGENLGWINFSGTSIDVNGFLKGSATTDNNGDIVFEGSNISVRSYWNNKKAPTDILLTSNNINENNSTGDIIGVISAVDENSTDTHTFSFNCASPKTDDNHFNISGSNILAGEVFDYETPVDTNVDNIYNVCVRVTDNTGLYFDKNINIEIINEFDAVNVNTNNCVSHGLQGFAWSDTVGWISFDCKNTDSNINYGVDIDKNGYLSGEAWSDTVGWISFDYYNSEESRPKFNKSTNKLSGYIKSLSGLECPNFDTSKGKTCLDDGFDGKISLAGLADNGTSYAPEYDSSTHEFDKYAWGSSVVGWIDFKTDYGVVTMDPFFFTFTSNKGTSDNPVNYNGSVVLSWATDGASSCVASNGGDTTWPDSPNKASGSPSIASETIFNLKEDVTFSLTCEDSLGESVTKDLDIRVAPNAPVLFLSADDDNISSGSSTPIKWNVENVENCIASSSSGTWSGSKDSTNGIHSESTGNLTESTNWFKLSCDSSTPEYYPNGVEELIYVDVEKLTLEFYPESDITKFNDKIKLYWRPEFAVSCLATGDLTDFNGEKDFSEGLHIFNSSNQANEGILYKERMRCVGTVGQTVYKDIDIKIGKNPKYQEL